jgi:hypothetical protein
MMKSKLFLLAAVLFVWSCGQSGKQAEQKLDAGVQELKIELSNEQLSSYLAFYFDLKNALVETDAEKAQALAVDFAASFPSEVASLNEAVSKIAASTDVEEQRKAFKPLSETLFAAALSREDKSATIYKQYCPMAFGNTGAYWLSMEKEILNPYFGDRMLRCGRVQEEI